MRLRTLKKNRTNNKQYVTTYLNLRNVLCRSKTQDRVWEVPYCCVKAGDLLKQVVKFQVSEQKPHVPALWLLPSSAFLSHPCQLQVRWLLLWHISPSASLCPLSPKAVIFWGSLISWNNMLHQVSGNPEAQPGWHLELTAWYTALLYTPHSSEGQDKNYLEERFGCIIWRDTPSIQVEKSTVVCWGQGLKFCFTCLNCQAWGKQAAHCCFEHLSVSQGFIP